MKKRTLDIDGRRCVVYGSTGPVIYWGAGEKEAGDATVNHLARLAEGLPWRLAAYEVRDWNADFSPWPTPAVFGREEFAGRGLNTLAWLKEACIPAVEEDQPAVRGIAGYSLAGLFSLWAFYESGLFQGAASCSGSLWYPGWTEYVQHHQAPDGSCVYLSLGDREEKTRNRTMAAVGDCTRWMKQQLENDARVRAHTLEWNPGGHFSEPELRLAKGMAWGIRQLRPLATFLLCAL